MAILAFATIGQLSHDHHVSLGGYAADAQFAAGTPVALSKVQPGDLLFYESPVVGHVSMAIGNGQMIEAPNSRSEVRIVPIRTSDFRGARRFF